MSKVNNLKEFIEARGLGEKDFFQVINNTFKTTGCGVWLLGVEIEEGDCTSLRPTCRESLATPYRPAILPSMTEDKEKISLSATLVDDSELGTEIHELVYPFTMQEFRDTLDKMHRQANDIWLATHGCDDCGPPAPPFGHIKVNDECTTCHGDGYIK